MSEQSETRKIIEDKLTGIHATLKAQSDLNDSQHAEIIRELKSVQVKQDDTNGRLKKVEKETRIFRYLEKKPLVLLMLMFMIVAIANAVEFNTIVELIKNIL